MMGILSSYSFCSRASTLFLIGLSHSNSHCRALTCILQPQRLSSMPQLKTKSGLAYYGYGWLNKTNLICGRRLRWQRDVKVSVHRATFSNDDSVCAASTWKFIHANNSKESFTTSPEPGNFIKNILVCGDGDLSYCAEIAPELERFGIHLYATVLEEEEIHNNVYQFSKSNSNIITASGQTVLFGVDATDLSNCFSNDNVSTKFDRIQFNFPHWKGKANNRYNRQLLNAFLQSAATVLSPRGEIHVALCDGQGGCSANSLLEWKGSWTASLFAGEHGLLLARVFPYEVKYRLSSHRGVDRPFNLGRSPKMHIFVKPDGIITAPKYIQLCCRHELHVNITNENEAGLKQVIDGDLIQNIIQNNCVPPGITVEVPSRQVLNIHESHGSSRVLVFLVVYCSEGHHLTRKMADEWRERTEYEVSKYVPLRENRRGRTVSHPFPYPALHPEIKYHTSDKII